MSNIKRYIEDGQIYFITAVTYNRKPIFKDKQSVNFLLLTIEYLKYFLDYFVYGYCIMPDHFHLLIMPSEKHNISKIMQYIKGNFARRYNQMISRTTINKNNDSNDDEERDSRTLLNKNNDSMSPLNKNNSRSPLNKNNSRSPLRVTYKGCEGKECANNHKNPVWQKRFYDEVIRDERDFNNKLNYIHNNPVKTKLVETAKDYKFSSYYQYYGKKRETVQMTISKMEL